MTSSRCASSDKGKGGGKSHDSRHPAYVMNAMESSAAANEVFLHQEQAKQTAAENNMFMKEVEKSTMEAVATFLGGGSEPKAKQFKFLKFAHREVKANGNETSIASSSASNKAASISSSSNVKT